MNGMPLMMRMMLSLLALLWTMAPPLHAEETPVVVELFTSQGCSSCPPADAMLHDLAKRPNVIALSLHVDYWDYIGWKDQFALASHTARQKAYASAGGRRMIYTPQMIVQGQDSIVGVKPMKVNDLIREHARQAAAAMIEIEPLTGGRMTVRVVPSETGTAAQSDVHLVRFTRLRSADITRGENAGREVDYVNVVEGWSLIGQWDGQGADEFMIDLSGDQPGVILVQRTNTGAILGARRLP